MDINRTIKLLEAKNTELNIAIDTYTKTNEQIRKEKDNLLKLDKLKNLIIDVGQKSQKDIVEYITSTVGLAIKGIFGEEYDFKIEFEIKRDQTECKFFVEKDGLLLEPRLNVQGGGIADVVAFAMHILILTLEKTPPILIMDEPQFKNVSKEHLDKVAEMVKNLISSMNIQLIMVTHISEMIDIADNIIEI